MIQRRRTRVVSRKEVALAWDGGRREGEIANLSMKGCLVALGEGAGPSVGDPVHLVIRLEHAVPDLDIRLEGVAVRCDGAGVAVDFSQVSPESFPRLFRLVQYNAADPEGIETELGREAFGRGAAES
jgi:hypothetical protein